MRLEALIVLAVLLLAGCIGNPTAPASTANPGGALAAAANWTLDCTLGSFEHAINASWSQTCEARASHNLGPKEENWLAMNPTDPNNVVIAAKDLDPAASPHCVWNGVFVTHDGGHTWKSLHIGGNYSDRGPSSPFYGYACNTDPDFQFTANGDLHYGVEMYGLCTPTPVPSQVCQQNAHNATEGWKILLATSHDGGDTWPQVITYQPDFTYTTDFSRMTVNPVTQSIVEAIGSDGGVGCHVLVSPDDGRTARPPVEVTTPYGPACGSGGDTAIAGSPQGVLTLMGGISTADAKATNGTETPIVVRSTDDGQTWTDANLGFTFKPIRGFNESQYRVVSTIELAYDLTNGTHRGTLYACYAGRGRDEADIYVRSSTNDGRNWTPAVRVNQDPAGTHQWMCNIAVAGDGSVQVFYMDKQYDPNHTLIDITHAMSLDGGQTWTNERVSTISYDGDLGRHQDGFPFIGDYLGVACGQTDCWAGFPDASNGNTTVTAAAHVHLGS